MAKTLNLIHPEHGVVASWTFQRMTTEVYTLTVMKVVNKWKLAYGKKINDCKTVWENE